MRLLALTLVIHALFLEHLIQVHTNSNCPYKRFLVAILPAYDSQQSESYYKYF